jgi:glycosyltransferase involved in cell wall biosynthesis
VARSAEAIRIAHVCSSDLSIPALMPFCLPLLARGWQITMITPDGPFARRPLPSGMSWLPFALKRRIDLSGDVVATLQLAHYLRRARYHIVHTHNIKSGQIGRVVAAALRAPIIVHTIHGMAYSLDTPPLKRAGHALLERIASVGCDLVFSQSREDLETYVATKVTSRDKLVWIGNGIDLQRFDPEAPATALDRHRIRRELGIGDDDTVFFSAGRLIVAKGFLELFEAAARARAEDPRIRLVVAGALDERVDTLDAATLDRARANGVLLLGRREDMTALYAASDVVVLASWHEGVPRVLMEGAAMGKPLIASDVRGCREVVQPPRHGLLVPVRDAGAFAGAMLGLARDPALRERLGRDNAREARQLYAIDRAVEVVNSTYDQLLARSGLA